MSLPPKPGAETALDEITALVQSLDRTERRLEELTGGEVDSVANGSGRPFLLRRAQEDLRQQDATKQAAILNALPAHVALLDAHGVIVSVNETWRQFARANLLQGPEAALGCNYLEICDRTQGAERPEAQQAAAGIRSVLDGAKSFSLEYPCHSPQEQRWFLLTVTPLTQTRAGGVIVMHLNITARRQATDALQISEQRFKALFEQAAVGVAQTDAMTGQFVQVNQCFADIVGRTREELVQITFASITHPLDLERDQEIMRRLRMGKIREFSWEKRYQRREGLEVWVNLTVSAMWAVGEPPGLCLAVVQDITERKRLDQHFLQAQKMEALGQFSGGVAHDFNNILAAISGYTELARMQLKANPEVCEHLNAVLRATGRAADLVRQILTFSRQQPQERRCIQLQPILAESVKLMRATIPTTIEFEVAIAADAPPVLANANQVHQVLMNLGINAWHAMKDTPGRLRVTLERFSVEADFAARHPRLRPGIYARVAVGDTGCGMDAATLRRIFEPFFTTKPPGEGTGLGLAVVDGIMEGHDGATLVTSRPGEGTTFELYFPAHTSVLNVAILDAAVAPRGHGERVLVVDDEELLAQLFQASLNALGYVAEMATDPVAALARVRAEPGRFALVLSDQSMPGMTGLALAGELTRLRPGLPVILITGYSASLTPDRLRAAGVHQLLLKPITIQALGAAVQATLAAGGPL